MSEARELMIKEGNALHFYEEELAVRDSIPDGRSYYDYIVKNVKLDRANIKNSYIMYVEGVVDALDMTRPCVFTKRATALPDIDTDFPTDYREDAIDYVRAKYGSDKVCQISTFGRLAGRSALKAVMRATEACDSYTMNLITAAIPEEAAISDKLEDMQTPSVIMWALENVKELHDYAFLSETGEIEGDYADVFKRAIKLEGTFANTGKHAAGVIISSEVVSDITPMTLAKDGSIISALDMIDLEKLGLVKFDFLGVDILNKISAVMGESILVVPLDDPETWEKIKSGNTKGCFQIEGKLGMDWSKELKPDNIEELAALISILRPGCLQSKDSKGRNMTKVYCDRKNGIEQLDPNDPLTGVNDTNNVIIYQETLLNIAKILAGFNSAESIKLMKSVGKKNAKELFSLEKNFLDGCKKVNKVTEKQAKDIFDNIKKAARYSFNKSIALDSTVVLIDSIKTIKEVSIGDIIKTPNGHAKILVKHDHGILKTLRLTLLNGLSIKCSAHHKFLCEDGIIPLYDMTENTQIITERGPSYIADIEDMGFTNLWDLEIDSEDHIFYANGIATSNSHAVSYAYLAYWSAYVKTHHPLEFYKTWLENANHKLEPHLEVKNLVISARADNISIEPPSAKYLNSEFFIEDDKVFFGLSHIKGCTKGRLTKLFEAMTKYGISVSPSAYLLQIFPNCNKTVVEALINAGAFGYLNISRTRLLHYYLCLTDLTDKEAEVLSERDLSLPIDKLIEDNLALKKEGGCVSVASRLPKVRSILDRLRNPGRSLEDTATKIAIAEEGLIGIPLSCSYMDTCLSAGIGDTTCREFNRGKGGKMSLVVRVTEVKEHILKDGAKMSFLVVSDDSAECDKIVLFKEAYKAHGSKLYPGAFVAIFGERSSKGSLQVDRVVEL